MAAKLKTALLIGAILLIVGLVSFFTTIAVTGMSDRVFPGVYVRGLHLGNMTRAEARHALEQQSAELTNQTVAVMIKGENRFLKLSDVELRVDTQALLNQAWAIGRRGNWVNQWQERKRTAQGGWSIPYAFSISRESLRAAIGDLTKEFEVPPSDARIEITPLDTVEIIESIKGTVIDLDGAMNQLQDIVANNTQRAIELALVPVEPSVTTEEVKAMKVDGLLTSFTTYFDHTKTNRVYNIKVAAEAIDELMIQPGEEFSFNKIVGPRSQEAGYKLAPAILNNEFIDSLGGGVCQVSTTLYNVLLRADVEIKQRSNHSLAVSYVPLGQDAAVAYGGKDLVFVNNLPTALIIKAAATGNALTIKLFGDTSLKKTVKITNNIIKEYPFKVVYKEDPTLFVGQEIIDKRGITGFRVVSTMRVYKGQTLVSERELLPSHYYPADQVVLVGTKPLPADEIMKQEFEQDLAASTDAEIPADQAGVKNDPGSPVSENPL